ncbi:unnamed protein product [Heligmosomoides polygyrus]|uniref:Carn_acyltransf domain-containing protein n=1 Tax=Heligmosomoides polygyrus TaxID=6339 RepID=A0A183GR31_HELPZ|nr:unnamed protein product [Heligmosomoides polygyrus]
MSVYAPQIGCPEHEDDFYFTLEEAIRSVPEGGYLSIAEDMNDGEKILNMAITYDLAVCSTFFAKRESQKVNYASGGRRTEVDHILVRRLALKTVRDVKVLPAEDVAQQHRPLVADLAIPLPSEPKSATSYEGGCSMQVFRIQLVP